MKRLIKAFDAVREASKCQDSIAFVRLNDSGVVCDYIEYASDKLWTSGELLAMNEAGYVLHGKGVNHED